MAEKRGRLAADGRGDVGRPETKPITRQILWSDRQLPSSRKRREVVTLSTASLTRSRTATGTHVLPWSLYSNGVL